MRAVIQRVQRASVKINGNLRGSVNNGLLVLLGIEDADGPEDVRWLSNKLISLRIFDDADGVMNVSLAETGGDLLLVSQFTLFASAKKGNRPSYIRASKAETAIPIYEMMIRQLEKDLGKEIQTGEFGADMQVELLNDGPVTLFIDTKEKDL